jgi:hypothetical protein
MGDPAPNAVTGWQFFQRRPTKTAQFTIPLWLCCLLVLLIGSSQWLPLVNAKWSIRDDHRFVRLMGNKSRIDFPTFLEQVNPPDARLGSLVNRPVYYAVHASWMLIFGNNVRLWQVAKLIVFDTVLIFSLFFLNCWVGRWASLSFTIFIATLPAWEDVVPRANSEIFGLAGLMLYLTGLSCLLRRPTSTDRRLRIYKDVLLLLLVALGSAIAVGSKENFCFSLLFLSCCLVGWFSLQRNRVLILAQLPSIAFGATIAYFIWHGISQNGGRALYGETFNLPQIGWWAFKGFLIGGFTSWLSFGFALLYAVRFLDRKGPGLGVILYELLLIGVFFLNAGFYAGLGLTGRYEFPVNLVPVFAVLPVIRQLEQTRPPSHLASIRRAIIGVLTACAILQVSHGFIVNFDRSFTYQRETQRFTKQLDKVSKQLAADPSKPVVFESFSVSDYEALISLDTFLRSREANNERFVKLHYSSSTLTDSLQHFMASLAEGLVGPGRRFKSFQEIGTRSYFRITISAPQPDRQAAGNFYFLH